MGADKVQGLSQDYFAYKAPGRPRLRWTDTNLLTPFAVDDDDNEDDEDVNDDESGSIFNVDVDDG